MEPKNKIRPIDELLEIVLEEFPNSYKRNGLCCFVDNVQYTKKITSMEWDRLIDFIHNNRPRFGQRFYSIRCMKSPYFWPPRNKKIRIRWLKYHIKKLRTKK